MQFGLDLVRVGLGLVLLALALSTSGLVIPGELSQNKQFEPSKFLHAFAIMVHLPTWRKLWLSSVC